MNTSQTGIRIADSVIHLQQGQVSVIIDATANLMPAVVYWGKALGELSKQELSLIARAAQVAVPQNVLDTPPRLGIIAQAYDGWLGVPGIQGGREASSAYADEGEARAQHLNAAGAAFSPRLGLVDYETFTQDSTSGVKFNLLDESMGLSLELRVEILNSGLVRLKAKLTNLFDTKYRLNAFTMGLPVPREANEILDFAGRWTREREPQRREVFVGQHLRENRRGRTGADSAYLMHVGTPGFNFRSGEVWALHTATSASHRHLVERTSNGETLLAGGEHLLSGEVELARGESYESPQLYAAWGQGLDQIAERFHSWIRSLDSHVDTKRPVTLNVWEAVYFDHDLKALQELADHAAKLGVERFVLDDGWFGSRRDDYSGLGDWVVSKDIWPNSGLQTLIEHVKKHGMQFGLWFEPEMVNEDSEVARAHPEWIAAPAWDRLPQPSRHQQVLNLALEPAYEHVRNQMFALLKQYPIDYIKWDCNRDFTESADRLSGAPTVRAQNAAAYRLMSELKANFPGLEIESCASGGARIDLGVLAHSDRVWVSDCIDPLERQSMNLWTNQLIPLELMGSHVASGTSHTTGRLHSLSFRAATALFGHLGIEWDLRQASAGELSELKEWIELYKLERDLLFTGKRVRVDMADTSVSLHGVIAADASRALFAFTALHRSGENQTGRLYFPALEPNALYRLEIASPAAKEVSAKAAAAVAAPTDFTVADILSPMPSGFMPSAVISDALSIVQPTPDNARGYSDLLSASNAEIKAPVLSGKVWQEVGIFAPILNPEQSIIFRLVRV